MNRKHLGKAILAVVLLLALLCGFAITNFQAKPMIYAKGRISLAPALQDRASGIRTLFITIFPAEQEKGMPYGASRYHLREDAAGNFIEFVLSPTNFKVMNEALTPPEKIRIKARLDITGQAGADHEGDLVGFAFGKLGEDIAITIDQVVDKL